MAQCPVILCLTFGPVDCEGPALVVGDVEGDGVAALAAAEVGQVAGVDAVVGAQVGVCKMRTKLDLANNMVLYFMVWARDPRETRL